MGTTVADEQLAVWEAAARAAAGERSAEDLIFISGSLVEGYGNSTSDLDVFVISDNPPTMAEESQVYQLADCSVALSFVNGVRTDVESWTWSAVTEIIDRVNQTDANEPPAVLRFEEGILQLMHRLLTGLAITRPALLTKLQEAVDRTRLAEILRARFVMEYIGHAEDAVGAVRVGDHQTASLISRWALGSAVDAYLAAYGETNVKAKWRFVKLRRHGLTEIADRYWSMELDNIEPAVGLGLAKERLRLAAQYVQLAQALTPPAQRPQATTPQVTTRQVTTPQVTTPRATTPRPGH